MKRRTFIYGFAALVIAFLAHAIWKTRLNFLVWNFTYFGVHVARAIHQPDYDSVASARVFDSLAILVNALIYFVVLLVLSRLVARLRSKRPASQSARLP
jgi:hypothetical protein